MIETKDLYSNQKECCGCEACADLCPKKIIRMEPADDGFMYPVAFNSKECIDCKRCLAVCPLKSDYVGDKAILHKGGRFNNENEIKISASGGLSTAISTSFIQQGGIVYGVSYSSDFCSSNYVRCDSIDQLSSLRGSKYAQERKFNVFSQVRKDLVNRQRVLFIGLPCVVNALKLTIGGNLQEKLYTASLICHGPTSPLVQKEYIDNLQNSRKAAVTSFTLRDKPKGWKPYFIKASFNDGYTFYEEFHPSLFGIAFKELKRPSCSVCKFKLNYNDTHVNADIIIGDFHGATSNFILYNKWGVSQCSVLTEKGNELLDILDPNFQLADISPRQAIHYNKALDRIIKPRWNRNQFARKLSADGLQAACQLKSITVIDKYEGTVGLFKSFLAKLKKRLLS